MKVLAIFVVSISSLFLKPSAGFRQRHGFCVQGAEDFAPIYDVSVEQCASACSLRNACIYMNYKRLAKECKLFATDVGPRAVRGKNCVLIERGDIDTSSVPAQCQNCNYGQVCEKTTGECTTFECPPLQLDNALVYGNVRTIGSRLKYTCDAGFGIEDGQQSASITCLTNGVWSTAAACIPDCEAPPSLPNAVVVDYNTMSSNNFMAKYQCNDTAGFYEKDGLTLAEMVGTCDETPGAPGIWVVQDFTCVKDCTDPPEVINADRTMTDNSPDSQVTYTCLHGSQSTFTATCVGFNGTWANVMTCPTEDECDEYLVSAIPDSSLTTSSVLPSPSSPNLHGPHHARLSDLTSGGWLADEDDDNPYIQASFNTLKHVTGVVTQFVTNYRVSYSRDCQSFYPIIEQPGTIQVFRANSENILQHINELPKPVSAMCVRIHPITHVAVRVDVTGCADRCTRYLVSGNYGVDDASLTATDFYSNDVKSAEPFRARLDTVNTATHYGGWGVHDNVAQTRSHYIQVRFRTEQEVSSIVTQGMNGFQIWIHLYTVSYSGDCTTFDDVLDSNGDIAANNDGDSMVENVLPATITALCVRIRPHLFNHHIGIRFDLKGCINDHVCPESLERFITPSIGSPLALRIMPGSYSREDARNVCSEYGNLVKLDTDEKLKKVISTIRSCRRYANHEYWVDGNTVAEGIAFSDGTLRPMSPDFYSATEVLNNWPLNQCVGVNAESIPPFQLKGCMELLGYVCEYGV